MLHQFLVSVQNKKKFTIQYFHCYVIMEILQNQLERCKIITEIRKFDFIKKSRDELRCDLNLCRLKM